MPTPRAPGGVDRRTFMGLCTALGLGGSGFPAALWTASRTSRAHAEQQAQQAPGKITKEMLAAAETVIGLEFVDAERA